MRLTKYGQSCVVVEAGDARIAIDPGSFALDAHDADDFGRLDAVLYTHRHGDHLDQRGVAAFRARGIPLYGNADVCEVLGGDATAVNDGETVRIAGATVVARDLAHVVLVDGSPGPPNTGFEVDGRLFHPGDGIALAGLRVDVLALPIAGPSVSFHDAYRFTQQTGAATVVPIHYEHFVADPELFARSCTIARVVVLTDGESVDL